MDSDRSSRPDGEPIPGLDVYDHLKEIRAFATLIYMRVLGVGERSKWSQEHLRKVHPRGVLRHTFKIPTIIFDILRMRVCTFFAAFVSTELPLIHLVRQCRDGKERKGQSYQDQSSSSPEASLQPSR